MLVRILEEKKLIGEGAKLKIRDIKLFNSRPKVTRAFNFPNLITDPKLKIVNPTFFPPTQKLLLPN